MTGRQPDVQFAVS